MNAYFMCMRRDARVGAGELGAAELAASNAKWSGGMLLLAAESDRDGNMGVPYSYPYSLPQSQACARATPQLRPPTTTSAYNYTSACKCSTN